MKKKLPSTFFHMSLLNGYYIYHQLFWQIYTFDITEQGSLPRREVKLYLEEDYS